MLKTTNPTKLLMPTLLAFTGMLSTKAAYDLASNSDIFPEWFVPSFIIGILGLIALSFYFVFQAWKVEGDSRLLPGRQSVYLWILMLLSFVCTTSVHGFYPFRSDLLFMLPTFDPILIINYTIATLGLVACTALAGFYIFGQARLSAVVGLMLLALFILVPNDNCANPFNYWWIDTVGASPLMYVPNSYAALFVTSGLHNVHPKFAIFLTMGICLASLLLGLGHQFGIIW